jgi:hypothetical protein
MKCPSRGTEMTEVLSWIEHPGAGGRMIGHPGPLLYYECKRCGTKIETKSTGRGNLKMKRNDSNKRG